MIDVHAAVVAIHDANLTGGKPAAIHAMTKVLADCWDDCAGALSDDRNPYRLALEITPNGPTAPHVERADEPAPDPRYADWSDVVVEVPAPPGHRRHLFTTTVDDEELAAMQIIVRVLDGLDQRAQNRVITYISERFA